MRVLIVDDHEVVRRGVRSLLLNQKKYELCGEAVDGQEALEKARALKPDVIVMDVSMPRLNGLEATRQVRNILPECEVLILSQHESPEMARQALNAGARGYVVKRTIAKDLIAALDTVSRHECFFDPAIWDGASASGHLDVQEILQRSAAFERALRESEQLYRSTFELAAVGVAHVKPDGRWVRVNQRLCEIVGYSEAELMQMTFQEITHPEDLPAGLAETETLLNGSLDTCSMEKRYIRKDGTPVWVNLSVSVARDTGGKVKHFIFVIEDIHERREVEEVRSRLAAIVESSGDAIVSKDLDGIVRSWNAGAARIFGFTAEEVVGRSITIIIPLELRDEEAQILRRLRNGERIEHFETVRVAKSGKKIDVSLTISPVRNARGQIVGASKIARDITELKRAEKNYRDLAETLDAEVRARTRELEDRNADVLRQSEQVQKLSLRLMKIQDEERRHMARDLHDSAGQTLTVLGIGLAQLVHDTERVAPKLAKDGEKIQQLVQQLHREIRTTSYLLHPPLLDETGLSSALSWYVQGLVERGGLAIDLSVAEDVGRLPADMELAIFRLVQESLTNVHRHSGSKTARITIGRDAVAVQVEVRDQGHGIATGRLEEIQSGRSGLGIRGLRERLRQFGGELNIESNGSGTCVLAKIPFVKEDRATDTEPLQTAAI